MSRKRHLITFLSIFALILGILHFYIYQRSVYYLQLDSTNQIYAAAILASLAILTLLALPLRHVLGRWFAAFTAWIIYPWMGCGLLLFSGFLIADFIWLLINSLATISPSLTLQKNFGLAIFAITGTLAAYALWNGLHFVKTRFVKVGLKKLPTSLDGLRIVQITDVHIGQTLDGKWLQKIVDRINALNADIIAITGDLVDGSVLELQAQIAPLANLKAKYGVYFVTGNHEYYSGADQWCQHLQNIGITVLRNRHVSINIRENAIDIAGVDDWSSRHSAVGHDLNKAVKHRNIHNPLILLAHQPITMHEAALHNVDLQLSGHTHGGQIWPFNYFVYLQQPVLKGLSQHPNSDLQIYVSAGTGFWGPPMRFGTFAEITCIDLFHKASA